GLVMGEKRKTIFCPLREERPRERERLSIQRKLRMNQDGLALPVPQDPQYRRDPITGHWILTASERSHRPIVDSIPTAACLDVRSCAFCEGNEEETPPEILALRNGGSADTGGWTIRVVPNRYPAVRMGIRDVDPQSV